MMLSQMIEEFCGTEVDFRADYHGRSFVECVAIVGCEDQCLAVIAEVINELHEIDAVNFSDCIEALLKHKTDSMGRQIVMYFPEIEPLTEAKADSSDNIEIELPSEDVEVNETTLASVVEKIK